MLRPRVHRLHSYVCTYIADVKIQNNTQKLASNLLSLIYNNSNRYEISFSNINNLPTFFFFKKRTTKYQHIDNVQIQDFHDSLEITKRYILLKIELEWTKSIIANDSSHAEFCIEILLRRDKVHLARAFRL